ncbi:MAG: indolepyruvate oxidoreductase subunit beta [Desulfobacterales bacterium]|nr:indolepyruvate oxidoreductase subunit beta [Pseudomonadota bacterium]MCG2776582.1 indolepyruvate oxidoreductase subunit beta [Desulfobacterales bacterium]
MEKLQLIKDPYNIVITGVGGQGNVLGSKILSNMLVRKGYHVTIGETFGASQRGGSVMSHVRVSGKSTWSPQIPKGKAHLIVALEPVEAIRVLMSYGNQEVKVLANTRPIYPVGVIAGELDYPSIEAIRATLAELSSTALFISATDEAIKLGNSILANIIMIGAASRMLEFPIDRQDFKEVIITTLPASKLDVNLKAFDMGAKMVRQ